MVKLNAEVIQSSHQYTNAVKERELDLRGLLTGIFCRLYFIYTFYTSVFPCTILNFDTWYLKDIMLNFLLLCRIQNSSHWKPWSHSGRCIFNESSKQKIYHFTLFLFVIGPVWYHWLFRQWHQKAGWIPSSQADKEPSPEQQQNYASFYTSFSYI